MLRQPPVRFWHSGWFYLTLAFAMLVLFQALPGPRPLDDAYITFRYARNLSQGLGFVYNPLEHVQGTTTPLYTLLLALLSRAFGAAHLPVISYLIALLADLLNTILLYRIARHLLKNETAALLLAAVFLLQPLRLNVAVGGMETSLFITFLLLMYERCLVGRQVYAAAFFAALAMLTRVDAVLAVAPVFLYAVWQQRWQAVKAGAAAAALLVPWFAWAAWYFGNPLPHSIAAKMAAYQNGTLGSSAIFLLTFLGTGTVGPYRQILIIFPGLVVALFLVIMGVRWLSCSSRAAWVVIAYPILYYLVMGAQKAPLFFCWYYLPLMPGFLLLFFGGLLYMTRLISPAAQARLLTAAAAVLVLYPALLMWQLPGWADSREIEGLYGQAASQLRGQMPPNSLVLAPDIGMIGWQLDQARILDPIGLVSPISLSYMGQRGEYDLVPRQMIDDLKPDYLIARDGFIRNLLEDDAFMRDYQITWQQGGSTTDVGQVLVLRRR